MKKTTMYILGGGAAVLALGGIIYAVSKKSALSSSGGGGGGGGSGGQVTQPQGGGGGGGGGNIQGNTLVNAPAPTGSNTTNPTTQSFQNPQQFAQDLSNFLNTMKIAGIGMDTINALYSGIQAFAASNLNFYLPALSPASFGFLF